MKRNLYRALTLLHWSYRSLLNWIQLDKISETLDRLKVTSNPFNPDGFHAKLLKQLNPAFACYYNIFSIQFWERLIRYTRCRRDFHTEISQTKFLDTQSYRHISLTNCIRKARENGYWKRYWTCSMTDILWKTNKQVSKKTSRIQVVVQALRWHQWN